MHKYKEPLTPEQLSLLDNLSKLDFSTFNESDVREAYISKVLDLLGYEKNTDYEVEREECSDLKWLRIDKAGLQRFDYTFNIRKRYFWLIEAKNGKNREITRKSEEQAYLYSLNPSINCRFFVVCNGWLFNLYDRNKFLSDDNSDTFIPILTIKSSELKEKFEQLYSYLGSSEIIFKIKEDILLRDIKSTLSAEINPDRLKQFSRDVDEVINVSASQVLENIRARYKLFHSFEAEKIELEKILTRMSLETVIDHVFDGFMTGLSLGVGCKVIKTKLLNYKNFFHESRGYSSLDMFFDYIFLRHIRHVQIEYIWNLVGLIESLERDHEFSGMMCLYNGKKIIVSELLDKYLYDMFTFFESRPDIRAYIIVYPIYYRIIKCMIYGFGNSIVSEIISKQINLHNYFWKEEELEKMHFSKGTARILMSRNIILRCMSDFNTKAFTKPHNNYPQPSKPSAFDMGEVVNTEIIKRTISELDFDLKLFENVFDVDKIREQSPSDEQDEMFSIDQNYVDPWYVIFMYSINTILNSKSSHKFSENILNQARYLVENNFISDWHYVQLNQEPENRKREEIEKNKLFEEYGITMKNKTEHDNIVADIKYKTWDRPEIMQWNVYNNDLKYSKRCFSSS